MVGCENFFIISIKIQSYFLKLLNPNPSTKDFNHHILGHLPLSKKNGKQGEVKQKTRSSWEKHSPCAVYSMVRFHGNVTGLTTREMTTVLTMS